VVDSSVLQHKRQTKENQLSLSSTVGLGHRSRAISRKKKFIIINKQALSGAQHSKQDEDLVAEKQTGL